MNRDRDHSNGNISPLRSQERLTVPTALFLQIIFHIAAQARLEQDAPSGILTDASDKESSTNFENGCIVSHSLPICCFAFLRFSISCLVNCDR